MKRERGERKRKVGGDQKEEREGEREGGREEGRRGREGGREGGRGRREEGSALYQIVLVLKGIMKFGYPVSITKY